MASPLKRGEKVLYLSTADGEVPGRVKEDEVNGMVLLDIRSRAVQATSVKRQRVGEAAARPKGDPGATAACPVAPAATAPSEGDPDATAARPVAPAATAPPGPWHTTTTNFKLKRYGSSTF